MVSRMGEPKVELLWWRGCPSTEEALAELRDEMRALGLDPAGIEVREVDTKDAASRERFAGSPTIRVEGRDVQDPGDEPIGLTCRVYRLRDGRVSAVPDRADVRDALAAAVDRAASA
jgi:hypothetical protein